MSKTTLTGLQWLKAYKDDIAKIKDSSPFLMVLCISAGIEFLGKLLSKAPIDNGDKCSEKFEAAMCKFESLKKYSNKNFYNLIRCGLAHRVSVKEGIILTRGEKTKLDNDPIMLNVYEFFNDFEIAVNEAQIITEWANSIATTNYVSINETSETGSTITMLNYE